MKRIFQPNKSSPLVSLIVLMCLAGTGSEAITVTVVNKGGGATTLSDFISYANDNNTGQKKVHLKKKDATDDINVAPGGQKKFDVGNHKSWTVSWIRNGKEVETDVRQPNLQIQANLAMFDSDFAGLYDLEYDLAAIGALPTIGQTYLIDASGHPIGTGFEWITFFDVTQSATGFIERDSNGNAISPLLPQGTEVTASFLWSVGVPDQSATASMLGLGICVLLAFSRMHKTIS